MVGMQGIGGKGSLPARGELKLGQLDEGKVMDLLLSSSSFLPLCSSPTTHVLCFALSRKQGTVLRIEVASFTLRSKEWKGGFGGREKTGRELVWRF